MATITDRQVRLLWRLLDEEHSLTHAALKCGMDRKTARRYRDMKRLPSNCRRPHDWRTRPDPFAEVWPEVAAQLEREPQLQPHTLFAWLQERYPCRFAAGQVRTLQRRIKVWLATAGPGREVFFAQVHEPGRLCASDFTNMNSLNVTIGGQPLPHLLYHFVLTYSNWESVQVCFAESFESLSGGLQKALWEVGGAPARHRSDRMSSAVNNLSEQKEFTARYVELLNYYGLTGEKIRPRQAHENGDAEAAHGHFKNAVDQALLLRGSRDFATRAEYEQFLEELVGKRNGGRQTRLAEEVAAFKPLPAAPLASCKRVQATVSSGSVISIQNNTYSVNSRLIGERVEARLYAERIEVWYGQQLVETLPRLHGRSKRHINYRHVIEHLVRKPGAFASYRYRDELFPTSRFRMAYDALSDSCMSPADKEYLRILHLAATEGESLVDDALRVLLNAAAPLSFAAVAERVRSEEALPPATTVFVAAVELSCFDELLTNELSTDKEVADDSCRESGETGGCAGEIAALPEGTVPAEPAQTLCGGGAASGTRDAQLRAVSAEPGADGVRGAACQADRTAAAPVAIAGAQGPGQLRSEAAAAESSPAVSDALGRQLCGTARERADFRRHGHGQDACVVCSGPGVGARGPSGILSAVQLAGAGAVGSQARPATEQSAAAIVAAGGLDHRRHRLRAAEPGGDGGAVHALGGALRAWQRAADEQLAVLEVGVDLQGRDDDGGGHRPAGAPQRNPGVEHAELPFGAGQEVQGKGSQGSRVGGPGKGEWGGVGGWDGDHEGAGQVGPAPLRGPLTAFAGRSAPQAPPARGWIPAAPASRPDLPLGISNCR
jgi:hypothetical protein